MTILVLFVLGIGNFALHKAVLESRHPFLQDIPGWRHGRVGRLTLMLEWLLLVAAMLLATNGWPGLVWAYGVYSALNAMTAWLILKGRI